MPGKTQLLRPLTQAMRGSSEHERAADPPIWSCSAECRTGTGGAARRQRHAPRLSRHGRCDEATFAGRAGSIKRSDTMSQRSLPEVIEAIGCSSSTFFTISPCSSSALRRHHGAHPLPDGRREGSADRGIAGRRRRDSDALPFRARARVWNRAGGARTRSLSRAPLAA